MTRKLTTDASDGISILEAESAVFQGTHWESCPF